MAEHLYPSELDLMDLTYFGGMAAAAAQNPLMSEPIQGLTVVVEEGSQPVVTPELHEEAQAA